MDLHIKGKEALVTGSTAGIGLAIAEELAREGANVIINGRTAERVKQAKDHLAGKGLSVRGIACDVGTSKGISELVSQIKSVDILVNNMGIYEAKEFFEISDEDWFRFFEVNVMSGIRLSKIFMPAMLKKNWGRIVFISSESAVNIPREMIHYGFTKTSQLAISRGLAELTVGTGVTVNTVLPGPTRSEGVDQFVAQMAKQKSITSEEVEKDFFKTIRPSSLIQRFATCEEVAAMVVYVCSESASATNGASLRVEGGLLRSIV
jgi:NAD(P)-dependent dehydrogenase (short-subunit alcohol dehydrogenase family)